jgi:translation initiation factor IF-2
VEVVGFSGAPNAGEEFFVVESEARAREVAAFRGEKNRSAKSISGQRGTLEEMFESIKAGDVKDLPIVIKADVQGSAEAIVGMFSKLPQEEVKIQVLHQGIGGINESDVSLAGASNAVIFGFNVRANHQARDTARKEGVDIRYYSIIYDVVDDIKKLLVGLMAPIVRETHLGNAEVREVFNVSKIGKVAGCFVTNGDVKRGAGVRLLRDDVVIHEGNLSTLKRFKDDVGEVRESMECGMSFENYTDLKIGDVIECFDVKEETPEI